MLFDTNDILLTFFETAEPIMPDWYFSPQQRGAVKSDPSEDLYFKHDQENEDTYAGVDNLVCEVLQNSLDAAANELPVRVRFAIHTHVELPPKERLTQYFDRLKEPLKICDKTFDFDEASEGFLVVEDFGTTGLEGDVSCSGNPPEESRENFFWFWRNRNRSAKYGNHLGRWGIGKIVYKQASRCACSFGLTIRESDKPKPYLMGQATLKIHQYNNKEYAADGYWGESDGTADPMTLPLSDNETVQRFREEWKLTRQNEPGLSVVVPYVHKGLKAEDILQAAAVHFFEKILQGKLIVEIQAPSDGLMASETIRLTAETLEAECQKIKWNGEKKLKRHQVPPFAFVKHCLACNSFIETVILGKDKIPELTAESFNATELKTVIENFADGQLTAVKMNLDLSNITKDDKCSDSFTVFVQKMTEQEKKEKEPATFFVRKGMTVIKPKSAKAKNSGVQALVRIDEGTLATLLGDAEGPAHEDWEKSAENVKKNWNRGAQGWIDFIKKSVDTLLLKVLNPPLEKADFDFLSGFFSVEDKTKGTKSKPDGSTDNTSEEFPPETPKWFKLTKQTAGFTIIPDSALFPPENPVLEISAAYDLPKGKVFKKWSKFDFDFFNMKKNITYIGSLEMKLLSGNSIRFAIKDGSNFKFKMSGFDKNRDLVIKIDDVSKQLSRDDESPD